MTKKTLALLFLVGVVILGFSIGLRLNQEPSGPRVAYSSVGDSNSWFITFAADLKQEADKRGYELSVTHANADMAKQQADVEDILTNPPDYLLFGPIQTEGSADALRLAKEAGVPVIVVNRPVEGVVGEDYVTLIGNDFHWIGEKMAELIHEAFDPDVETIRVVELHGTVGGGNTIGMQEGFRKKMEEYPNMEIVSSQLGNYDQATAMAAMENILQSGVEFDAVVGHFDTEAMGAINAMLAAGRKPGSDPEQGEIIVVGNGGTKDGLQAIKDGSYHKIVSVSPFYAGQVFDAIEAHTAGEELPAFIRVDDIVIDKSNVDEHMDKAF